MGVSSQRHAMAALYSRKGPSLPIWQEAGWASEPVWTQRLEEKSSAFVAIQHRSPVRPVRSQTLYWLMSYPGSSLVSKHTSNFIWGGGDPIVPRASFPYCNVNTLWPQWPRGLRRRSSAALLLGSNPVEGMDVCLLCLYVVLSCVSRGLCDGLITRPQESYRVSNCVCLRNLNTEDKAQILAVVP
jgi:hypothetical protein